KYSIICMKMDSLKKIIINRKEYDVMLKIMYFKNDKCGVCTAFLPKIQRISKDYELELEVVDVVQKPEVAGQNMVFTVPTILIIDSEGNEIKRFARSFSELEIREYLDRVYDILGM
ncbi:MAG TPA: thioredoxin family protein, partial [Fervidobacterium nodosum]|nr:thioredoxin family protein [Fervidobacterium nodosum]